MFRLSLPFVLASCLLVPPCAFAQKPATVMGNVYYADDYRPAGGVVVSLSDSEHILLETQQTTDAGEFRFGGLKRSVYQLSISTSGYEPATLSVDVSFASDKGISIYLRPIGKKQETQKGSSVSVHQLSMPAAAREWMESGQKKLYQEKDAFGALGDFERAIDAAPGYYEAHYQAAVAYVNLGNKEQAERSFRKAAEVSGDKYGEADVGLGTLMVDGGNFLEGEKTIRRGIELAPNFWLGYYELGRVLLNEKRIPEALISAEQVRGLAPNEPIVYRLLSNIHLLQKDYPALLKDIDAYLKLDPDSAAGIRAKELRGQIERKIGAEQVTPTSETP